MKPKVLFIGSIGTVAETSEFQRLAYNQALKENDVNWEWSKDIYKSLLKSSGGIDRLETLSKATNQNLLNETIKKVHARKTELACEHIIKKKICPREGLTDIIEKAKHDGVKVAWVTTTGKENTDAIIQASQGKLSEAHFDYIFHRHDAKNGKPSSDIYHTALSHFNVKAHECIAIEDSLNSVLSSKGAGIFTVVTPGNYHDDESAKISDVHYKSLDQTDWATLKSKFENIQSQAVSSQN